MIRRMSMIFKNKDRDKTTNSTSGANGTMATINEHAKPAHQPQNNLIASKNPPPADPSDDPDHSASRDGNVATFKKFAQVVHAASRSLATGTGDGSYVEDAKTGSLPADLTSLNVKDFETLNILLKKEPSGSRLADDMTMIMERVIQLVSKFPPNSVNRGHPPPPMLGDKYNYRQADGSYNNLKFPEIGKAGTPYTRRVPPRTIQPNPKVDPGVIFDTIFSRENGGFKPHPNNVSSMLYYISSIIIHDCFRTSQEDFNISLTSSYLDLSPLYGSNQAEQDTLRTFKDGKLKPDCFSEKRLLGFPPGVGCILIMFNRFHNYVSEQLAVINENGRFNKPSKKSPDTAWKKYDNDLFQTARLITCGLYINVILLDYLRTTVGLNRVHSTWTLDPRVEMDKDLTPHGTGNQCSVEFNLVYRWHSCISQRDEKWSEDLYAKLFNKHYKEVTMQELVTGLGKLEAMTPDDPLKRDFEGLKRTPDGKLNDDDLVKILTESIEDVAGSSGANNVPAVLRAVEILGMQQARSWKCATLNEFRKFFGLTPYEKFEDINSDPAVSAKLKALFDHPDFVELYPGLVCEDAKQPMDPGVGIEPTYTISRSIVSDTVSLIRGDRLYTDDYHAANLTNWGFKEVAYDLSVNQGCVFYKLFLRAFPNHFKFNSIYAHYPLTIPKENKKIMANLERLDEFSWDRPARVPPRANVASYDGVLSILKNDEAFGVDPWRKGFSYLMGKQGADFMLAGDGPFFTERREQMKECLYQKNWEKSIKDFYEAITLDLIKKWSCAVGGTARQVDIIRDVGNSAHTYFAANIFMLPLKSDAHPKGAYTEHELYKILALMFVVIFFEDVDPAKTFPLRTAGLPLTQGLGALVEQNVSIISNTGLIAGNTDPLMKEHNALTEYGVHMIRNLLKGGLGVHETTWSQVLPTAGAMVANQAQAFAQIIDFYTGPGKAHLPEIHRLAKLDTPKSDETLLHYVMEAIRINGSLGAYRKCKKDTSIPDKNTPDGKRVLKEGDNVFVSFVDIAKDEAVYPNPHVVDPTRPIDSYIMYGIGPHKCLGESASKVALTAMLKVVGRLNNLRAAPGPQGTLKKIPREGGFYVYMDEFQGGYTLFPASLKILWDEVKDEQFPTEDWMWAYVG